jgi:hypothetical protein
MNNRSAAVHRTIVVVDIEGFGDRHRTDQNQLVIREGLYLVVREAFRDAGISWVDQYYEDRGDGIFVLVSPEVPKSVLVELLPYTLLNALRTHNNAHQDAEKIRLRMAIHAGEINYDEHGVTSSSIIFAFRLIAADSLRKELAQSLSPLAVITSAHFYEEVVRHSIALADSYRPIQVKVKEVETLGWIHLPDYEDRPVLLIQDRSRVGAETREHSTSPQERAMECREALRHYYKAALTEPITPTEGMPIGLAVPTLEEGYIDHRIRVRSSHPLLIQGGNPGGPTHRSTRRHAASLLNCYHLMRP